VTLEDAIKMFIPILVSYIALLRTRTELDILYAKHREKNGEGGMRAKWYHVLKGTREKKNPQSKD
jgi:hypothetical protein